MMRASYFKEFPDEAATWYQIMDQDADRATLIERIWTKWYDDDFVVCSNGVIAWEHRPLNFALFSIKRLRGNVFRCAIENSDDPNSHALFDLVMHGEKFVVISIRKYAITNSDETLIRLVL